MGTRPEPDHYRVLGVSVDADGETIRTAYRRLAWRHHPDRRGERPGDDTMLRLNTAFDVLGDPARRADYDRRRRGTADGPRRTPPGAAQRASATTSRPRPASTRPSSVSSEPEVSHLFVRRVLPALILVTLTAIVIFTAFAGGPDDGASDRPTIRCVLSNRLVPCSAPHDARIVGYADVDHTCPDGTRLLALADEYCVAD